MSTYASNPSVSVTSRCAEEAQLGRPRVIVLGNEKGGSGKSTTAMHLIVALLRQGRRVGVIDLDARQGTLSRYVENRQRYIEESGIPLPMPRHARVMRSEKQNRKDADADERQRLMAAVEKLSSDSNVLVIDTPGSDAYLSRMGHTLADVLISPMNDSFVDLDLLARFDGNGRKIMGPSVYAQMVWEQRQQRARMGGQPVDWVVMRNRLSHLDAKNKQRVGQLLEQLSSRLGFRLTAGFSERVVFRELFPRGLTLMDLRDVGQSMSMSHLAARQEVRDLMRALDLDGGDGA